MELVAKTFFGLEEVLKKELQDLGADQIKVENRAVSFQGDWDLVYKANVAIRTAIAIILPLKKFKINTETDLYKEASKMNWEAFFDVDKTIAVRGAVHSDLFRHSQYPLLVVKDAVADSFRKSTGKRPDVNLKVPQILIDVHIAYDEVQIGLNTSGDPLFKRGYRSFMHQAPLNEVTAAGLILLSGWDKKSTFVDPMCGSGTIPIEAGLMANNIPPNISRRLFAFKNYKNFDAARFEELCSEFNNKPLKQDFEILGFDKDPNVIRGARENLRNTSLARNVKFEIQEIEKPRFELEPPGVIVTNPPYDERLEVDDVEALYKSLGDYFKQHAKGFKAFILSADKLALKAVGLKTSSREFMFNGKLKCGFFSYDLYEGSKKVKLNEED